MEAIKLFPTFQQKTNKQNNTASLDRKRNQSLKIQCACGGGVSPSHSQFNSMSDPYYDQMDPAGQQQTTAKSTK